MFDAVIVGGGPAGLSAALILGRCRRRVLLCDSGTYRNAAAHEVHGFLTRDGIAPDELRQIGRAQLRPYGVEVRDVTVSDASRSGDRFEITLATGERVACRKLLLATGLIDELPDIEGLRELYGESVFHCPYCDGWEVREQPLAVYGLGSEGVELALTLTTWSSDIVLCTDGPALLDAEDSERLAAAGIAVREEWIVRLERRAGALARIVFDGGGGIERRALFMKLRQKQGSDLAAKLQLDVTAEDGVLSGKYEETRIKGVFVAGDASRDVLLAIVAAAEGAKAAFGINCELQAEDQAMAMARCAAE